jgi:uncharacterized membrane protein YbjE (DUF340 family)
MNIGIFIGLYFSLLVAHRRASFRTAIQKVLLLFLVYFYGLKVTNEIGENLKKTLDRSLCFWYI